MKLEKIDCDTDNLRISIVFYMKKKKTVLKNEYVRMFNLQRFVILLFI